ncbi:MAG: FG-GAP repeat protein [Phycisphaerae bacterium]|nr:FG-GAP repeat protein [Phycisphaerae bacterium]
MRNMVRGVCACLVGLVVAIQLGGCPSGIPPLEYVAGGTGDSALITDQALVDVLTPTSNLSITGGTQVEVNWRVFATSRYSTVSVIIDQDQDPDNGNEVTAYSDLELTESKVLVDTTRLLKGTYYLGVVLVEVGEIVTFDYASGTITIDQRPTLFFTSPRDNLVYDRTEKINPTLNVAWELSDPDSVNTVEILLDPDDSPNGNEVLLYHSDSQGGDSFTFDLPTAAFDSGTYRLLAVVSDGENAFSFYAPGTIRLRSRLAGPIDLRDLHLSEEGKVSGVVFEGFNPRDNAGSFVSSLKDVDGDGFSDVIILSQFGKARYESSIHRTGIGEAYLVYGRPERFSGVINLNSTGTLFRGEFYTGAPETSDPIRPSRGITSFTMLSDWDSDGVREMAFGLPFTDSVSAGTFTIGSTGGDLAPLDPAGYFRTGTVVVVAGSSLRPDLGFPGRNVFNLAEFGTLAHMTRSCGLCYDSDACACLEGFWSPKAPAPLGGCSDTKFHEHIVHIDGTPNTGSIRLGCRFSSMDFGDQFGESVSSWDFDAIIMSAPNRDPSVCVGGLPGPIPGAGVVSIFFTDVKDGFYPWTNNQAPAANSDMGYRGSAQSAGDRLLPHGGPYHYLIDDLLYSPGYTVDPDDSTPCERVVDAHIVTPDRSVRFWSQTPGARLSNVEGLDDVNGDGLLDLVIGAPLINEGSGACYIVLGRLRELVMSGELPVEEFGLPMSSSEPAGQRIYDGIRILGGPGERLGQSQDDAGDFNNDGFADVVIGSPLVSGGRGGAAVFFGSREVINLTQAEIPYNELPARGLGVVFVGEDENDLAGARVAGAGDIDGDGNDDILIAAPNRSIRQDLDLDGKVDVDRTYCGVVYLIYGSPDLGGTLNLSDIGTETLPGAVFIGRRTNDYLGAGLGEQGDRSTGIAGAGDVDGDGAGDILLGSVTASPRDRAAAGETYLLYGVGD